MSVNYGSKRLVVGAHYGFRDWLSQRVTAALMALFTVAVVVQVLLPRYVKDAGGERARDGAGNFIAITGYDKWAGMFAAQWMKVLTFAVIAALLWHVWVGMRDVLMDYVKPVGLRLAMQVFAIVWLTGCAGWALQVLWRL
jgi:succinate dehydrogenase / fumarate reductase, membrane anchor subunit